MTTLFQQLNIRLRDGKRGNRPLRGHLALIFLAVGFLSTILTLPAPVLADAPSPMLAVGDEWKYNFQISVSSLSIQATLSMTVEGEETVTVQGTSYPSFRTRLSASGTVSGSGLSGTYTLTATANIRSSDLAEIKGSLTQVISLGFTLTQTVESTTNPPSKSYDFPLSVGKTWTQNTTTTTTITETSSISGTTTRTSTNTTQSTYTVLRTETVTVPAGTFETFVISKTDSTGGTVEDYYSPQVGGSVKATVTESGATTTIVLTEVRAWPYRTNVNVVRGGQTFTVPVRTNVDASNLQQNSTAISFQVSGATGLTGSARVSIPKGLNNTSIRVYVDSNLATASITGDSTSYHITFGYTLSIHTITVMFAQPDGLLSSPYVLAGIGAGVAAAIALLALLLVRKRKKGPEIGPTPSPAPTEPSTTPSTGPAPRTPSPPAPE